MTDDSKNNAQDTLKNVICKSLNKPRPFTKKDLYEINEAISKKQEHAKAGGGRVR